MSSFVHFLCSLVCQCLSSMHANKCYDGCDRLDNSPVEDCSRATKQPITCCKSLLEIAFNKFLNLPYILPSLFLPIIISSKLIFRTLAMKSGGNVASNNIHFNCVLVYVVVIASVHGGGVACGATTSSIFKKKIIRLSAESVRNAVQCS